ncbi:MAG: carboxypeptidase M32 [Candidatus Eisenbacteria bacterium]|nr:carboxypeptidase M32 [Candidatus Eisenbacteria bacterium]
MHETLKELKGRLLEIYDLSMAAAVLRWDQATYMPPGGAGARGRQMATLSRIAHERLTEPGMGRLLDRLEPWTAGLPHDSDEACLVRVTRRAYDRAIKVPSAFVSELDEHASLSYQTWTTARPRNDFASVRPLLEKTLEMSRRLADFFPGYESIADPLIDYSDYGMKASSVRAVFAELRARLVPLVRAITERPAPDDRCLRQSAPEADQLAFGLEVLRKFGFHFERGRQDLTHHPFMTKFSLGDVRITTRVRKQDLTDALFSTLHEAGHAMYEQGIRRDHEGTPLADGASAGVHESQSRLWENLVGRSRGFWEFFYPKLQAAFPAQLRPVPLDTFYRAINRVERSLIRTDADEVTYNLHVMMRFDLELDLLEGRLAVRDLPEAWRARFESDLGIPVPDDRDGVLQDVHWFSGPIGGAFQGYTLGNILSAQFFAAAIAAHPGIGAEIARGEFDTLHGWLREHVYQHGARFTAAELVERATGSPMTIEPYIAYLWGKYQPLYGLAGEQPGALAGRRAG